MKIRDYHCIRIRVLYLSLSLSLSPSFVYVVSLEHNALIGLKYTNFEI